MKSLLLVVVLCAHASALKRHSVGASWGPRNCVTLTRSSEGTCVINTDCEGADTSKTEFAFDCVGVDRTIVKHSFGVGTFDATEEYDTEVKCVRCDTASPPEKTSPSNAPSKSDASKTKAEAAKAKPTDPAKKGAPTTIGSNDNDKGTVKAGGNSESKPTPKPAGSLTVKPIKFMRVAKATKSKTMSSQNPLDKLLPSQAQSSKKDAVRYGPEECVSVYRSKEGHCIMSTQCKEADISDYEFGLVCADKVGTPVRHLFGKGSFDAVETFDTLIKCDQCLGLEKLPSGVKLAGEVGAMAKEVDLLKDVIMNISKNVDVLNDKVFGAVPKAIAVATAPAPAVLVHAAASHQRTHQLRHDAHHQNRRHHRHHDRQHTHHHRQHRQDDDGDDDGDYHDGEDDDGERSQALQEVDDDADEEEREIWSG